MNGAVRLDKLLANLGYGSRREVQAMARAGRIMLDDAPLGDGDCKLGAADAKRLRVDGDALDPLAGLVLMLHKPVGMICSHDEAGPLVYDRLPPRWRRRDPPLSSVGRLDKETSGLLLMTDDGALLHRIIAPKTHVPKRYRATLARPIGEEAAALFASGTLMLKGESKALLPARLEVHDETHVSLTIAEGRYHQVRRMFAALGNHVEALHRDRIGGLCLPDTLDAGAYRVLDAEAIQRVFAEPVPV